jgi:hypothetical protein
MNGTAKSARRLLIATAILILLVFAAIVWAPESSRDDDAVPWIVAAFLGTLVALEYLWAEVTLRRLFVVTAIFALLFGTLALIQP